MAHQFQIERGVPMPPAMRNGAPLRSFPWRDMAVGDSFFVPSAGETQKSLVNKMCQQAYVAAKRIRGVKFSVRAIDGGVRVWRVA